MHVCTHALLPQNHSKGRTNPWEALSAWVEEYICADAHKHKGFRPVWHKHKLCNSSSFVPSSTLNQLVSFHHSACHAAIECRMSLIHSHQQPESSIRHSAASVSITAGVTTVHQNCSCTYPTSGWWSQNYCQLTQVKHIFIQTSVLFIWRRPVWP